MPDPQAIGLAPAPAPTGAGAIASGPRKRRYSILTRRDKIVLVLMVGIPTALDLIFIWLPTLASILLSFTNYQGIGGITAANSSGSRTTSSWSPATSSSGRPSATTCCGWRSSSSSRRRSGSSSRSCSTARSGAAGSTRTSSTFPVVLSLAVVGFIWELQYAPDGFIDSALGLTSQNNAIDWLGNPSLNIWAVLVAASWRHVGYIMVLYLAGLKSVDPTLREAAAIDGASELQTFFRVVFPVMAPINIVIVVVTVIESLRAFDLAFIINQGTNGLELLSTLITNNSISEASLVGFGSSIAVVLLVISLVPIVIYLSRVMRSASE